MSGAPSDIRVHALARAAALVGLLVGVLAACWQPGMSIGATSSSVVGANVPSAITLGDQCGAPAAWRFGAVSAGASALTATGAGVCRYTFSSTNDSSMLRLYQSDTSGQAMVAPPSAWANMTGSAPSFRRVDGFGTSLLYATAANSGTGAYQWSTDGGVTWNFDAQGGANFASVSVPSATVAWRIGPGGGQRSSDANANPGPPTWSAVSRDIVGPPTTWDGTQVTDIDAIDYSTAWLIANANAYRTTNPGAAEPWEESNTGCTSANAIDALDATIAFVVGTGRICRTINGGTGWTQHTNGLTAGLEYNDIGVSPQTSTTIWAVGDGGSVVRSTDNGINWSAFALPIPVTAFSIDVISDTELYVGAEDGLLFRTTTSAGSWTRIRVPVSGKLDFMHVGDSTHLYAGNGGDALWQTANGGTSWSRSLGSPPDMLLDIDAVNDDVIVAARADGVVRVTTNGGVAWTDRATGLAPDNIRGVAVLDDDSFIAVGDRGGVALSDDAGATWSVRPSGTTEDLWDVDVQPNGTAIAIGANGTILRSSDRGWSWSVRSAAGADLRKVAIRSGGLAVAVGLGGVIRRSTDDGITWSTPASGVTGNVMSVSIASPTVVYAGVTGSLLKSVDAGATWATISMGSSFKHVAAVNEDVVYMSKSYEGGWTQWVTRSDDGGATWVSPFGNNNPYVRSLVAIDGGRVLFASWNDWIRATTPGASVPDYAAGGWSGGASLFGGCLQDLGGSATVASWVEDASGIAGQCEVDDADPWNPVTTAPVKIAQMAAAGTGNVDLVWGFKADPGLLSGSFSAGVVVEAVAPNA